MRQLLFGLCAAATFVACAAEPAAEPLTLDEIPAAGSVVSDPTSGPVVLPETAPAPTEPSYRQPPDDVVPGATPGGLGDSGIGDFCADHLEPAQALLEAAEQLGSIAAEDLAVVQATLDTALDYCTPSEYFAFQEAVFAFVDPGTAPPVTTVPPEVAADAS